MVSPLELTLISVFVPLLGGAIGTIFWQLIIKPIKQQGQANKEAIGELRTMIQQAQNSIDEQETVLFGSSYDDDEGMMTRIDVQLTDQRQDIDEIKRLLNELIYRQENDISVDDDIDDDGLPDGGIHMFHTDEDTEERD